MKPLDEDTLYALYVATHDRLTAAGFEHYEISSYARPGKRAVAMTSRAAAPCGCWAVELPQAVFMTSVMSSRTSSETRVEAALSR